MSDENKPTKVDPPKIDLGDWSPDYFPTSAKSIFRKAGLWLLGIAIICGLLAYWSSEDQVKKQESDTSNGTNQSGTNTNQNEPEEESEDEVF